MMRLTGLSFQRVKAGRTPRAPDNDERIRSYRSVAPVRHSKNFPWAHRARAEYDPAPETEIINYADRRGT